MLALMTFFTSCATNSGSTGEVKVSDGNTVHELDAYLTNDLVNNMCVKEKLIKLFESNEARKAHGITDKDFEKFLAESNALLIQKIHLMNAEIELLSEYCKIFHLDYVSFRKNCKGLPFHWVETRYMPEPE